MDSKKLNILFLSTWYPNRVLPTLGNFVQKHAEAIALRSNVIALSVCSDSNCRENLEITESEINKVHTIHIYYKKVGHSIPLISHIQKAIRFVKAYSRGLKIVNTRFSKIDLVHHNILYPIGIVAWYLKKIKNIPYIITEHSTLYLSSKAASSSWFQKTISKTIARNASVITPVSKDLGDAMIKTGLDSKHEVIYNVVDTKLFYPQEKKLEHKKIKLLHISTLDDAHKNISGMLRVAANLSKHRTDFEFWFVGDGDTSPHIKTATELGIYNSFAFFDGIKTTEEVAAIMRNSDCFVLFSNYENLPVVLIEAFASGIPVVSSSVGGIPEHLTSNFGSLVEPKDEKGLENALHKVIEEIQQGKYNAQEIAGYANSNFSYEKVSEKFHHLYHRILKINV